MCALCEKIRVVKDILSGYFTDEELNKMNDEIDMPGFDVRGTRLSVCLMAIAELCVEAGLTPVEIHDGVQVAIMRDYMRRAIEKEFPGRHHTIKELSLIHI